MLTAFSVGQFFKPMVVRASSRNAIHALLTHQPVEEDDHQLDGRTVSVVFTLSSIALAAKVCAVDGPISGREFAAFLNAFKIPKPDYHKMRMLFRDAYREVQAPDFYARQVARMVPHHPRLLQDLVQRLIVICAADGLINLREAMMLKQISTLFMINPATLREMLMAFYCPKDVPHMELFGLNKRATAADLKQAYRALSRELHPDILLTEPHDALMIEVYNQRFAMLHTAYKTLLKRIDS